MNMRQYTGGLVCTWSSSHQVYMHLCLGIGFLYGTYAGKVQVLLKVTVQRRQ